MTFVNRVLTGTRIYATILSGVTTLEIQMAFNNTQVRGFTPSLYIGIGETCAFYTLRETYLHETFIPGAGDMGGCVMNGVYQGTVQREVRSFHHFNLAQDMDEAFEKAQAVSRELGLDLTTKREAMSTMMRDIVRRGEEEMRAERIAQSERANAYVDQYADRWVMENLTVTHRNSFGYGKYAGKTFAEINAFDRDYLNYMVAAPVGYDDKPEKELRRLCLETFLEKTSAGLIETDAHFGTVGDRVTIDVTVKAVKVLHTDYGTTLLIKLVGSEGHRFTSFYSGNKFNPKAGETFTIKATIKGHDDYDGINQTMLNRIAPVQIQDPRQIDYPANSDIDTRYQ